MTRHELRLALFTSLCALALPASAFAQADAGVAPPDASSAPDTAAHTEAEHHDGDHHDGDHHDGDHHDGDHHDDADHHDGDHHDGDHDDGGHHHHHHHHHDDTEVASTDAVPPAPGGAAADLAHPGTPSSSPPSTPTPSATGATSAAPVTAMVAGVAVRLTGIVWAAAFAGTGVESYGWANSAAPTSALNPLLLGVQAADAQLSFQVQQSRFGLTLGEGSPFRGTFEIDFIHFDQQSSPTTQAFPRIRIAMLEWHFDANNRIFVGQGWDLFGNTNGSLLSHSANLVGTLFQAGNVGFMRQQIGWSGRFGEFEIALAVGMQGNNAGPTFNNLEESATPTGSARVMYHVTETSVFGVSGITTAPRFTDPTNPASEQRRLALGGELFGDLTFGPVNFHAEAYLAQNLANTGALNLAQGRWNQDMADAGGYLSARVTLSDWAVTGMFGFAGLLNPLNALPAYTVVAGPPGTPYLANTAAGPGMEWNMTGHVGLWFSPMRGLSFVLEPYFYFTRFIIGRGELYPGGVSPTQISGGGQFTTMFQF